MSRDGIVYAATGSRFVEEALEAAAQVKTVMPHLPMTFVTDQPIESSLFERVVILKNATFRSDGKIQSLQQAPYERTLYLDTDIYVVKDISDVFDVLDQFDIALSHDPGRMNPNYPQWNRVPYSFSQFNAGLIAVKRSPIIANVMAEWQRLYYEYAKTVAPAHVRDQPALREALYFSQARIATLPPEYNFRPWIPAYFHGEVKVLHGRSPRMASFASTINQGLHSRVVILKNRQLKVYDNLPTTRSRYIEPAARAQRWLRQQVRKFVQ